jgi:hypothetical protein
MRLSAWHDSFFRRFVGVDRAAYSACSAAAERRTVAIPPRDALRGILFVLHTGVPWEHLPHEVAGCSCMTCWGRLHAWQQRCSIASAPPTASTGSVLRSTPPACQLKRAAHRPEPDRSRQGRLKAASYRGCSRHPLAIELTAANVNDCTRLIPLIDAIRRHRLLITWDD